MATDPRIQTIGEIPVQSGVGQMLFENLEAEQKSARKLKEVDAIGAIQSKYRAQEQEKANQLAVGLENLRNQFAVQRSQEAFQQEMGVKQQAATYLQGLVGQAGQQGVDMPGLARPTIGTPEAGIPGVPEALPIQPGAVDIARDQYARYIDAHLRGIEQRQGLSMEAERKRMFEEMDRMTDDDAREVNELASQFEASNDMGTGKLIRSFATPGRGSRTEWAKFRQTALPKLMTAQAANQTRLAIAAEVSARNKEVQKLKSQAAQLLAAPKLEMAQFKQLQGLHTSLGTQLRGYRDMHQRLEARLYTETGPEAEAKIRTQMRQLENEMQVLENTMSQVSGRMGTFEPTVTPGGGLPTPRQTIPGGLGGVPARPSGNDPLGVRR